MKKLMRITSATSLLLGLGLAGIANASQLQIVGAGGGLADPANQEAIGDPGGSAYPATSGTPPGPGLPTALGGWPNSPNFAADTYGYTGPGGAPALGISGYDGSYLNLTSAGTVNFQFMGRGDAQNTDLFQINLGNGWVTEFNNQTSPNCGAAGSTPAITCSNPGSSFSQYFNAGLIAFRFYDQTSGDIASNIGLNPKDIAPGFFLGVDPYLATGQYDTSGNAIYAGFTDLPPPGDHDYEDLVVRISVPEPGSILLLGIGLTALVFGRQKMMMYKA